MTEQNDEDIREFLERNNPEFWAELREAAASSLEETDVNVTPELVDATAVAFFRRQALNTLAKMEEFIPTEERRRIYKEEEARLQGLYPEGFPEEVWTAAVMRRLKEEYPDAF